MNTSSDRPRGVGFTYRPHVHDLVMASRAEIDFIEVPSVEYLNPDLWRFSDAGCHLLDEAVSVFPAVGHGGPMELFRSSGAEEKHLDEVRELCIRFGLSTYSEHLSITDGIFVVPPFNEQALEIAVHNVRRAQAAIGVPLLIENVACDIQRSGGTMREGEFLRKLCDAADCYLLLDVANVYVNAANSRTDPKDFLRDIPRDRVVQIHYCGVLHGHSGEVFDSHSEPTQHEVWDLLDWSLRHTSAEGLILERDSNFGDFKKIRWELEFARELYRRRKGTGQAPAVVAQRPRFDAVPVVEASISASYRRVEEAIRRILLDPGFAPRFFPRPIESPDGTGTFAGRATRGHKPRSAAVAGLPVQVR